MATIKLNDSAPTGEAIHFSFAGADFDLDGASATFETDNPQALDVANSHEWLTVEYPPAPEQVEEEDDPNDPHEHPEVDPFSIWASDETKAKHEQAEEETSAPAPEPVVTPPAQKPVFNTTTSGEND